MLHWTFGVLYMGLAICLYSLFFLLFWEFAVVVVADDVSVGVGDCQNDSIVGWFTGSGLPLHS